jgi:hypothetical protein
MKVTLERVVLTALALVGAGAVFMSRNYGDGTAHGGNLVPVISGSIVVVLSIIGVFRPLPTEALDNGATAWRPWTVLASTIAFLALMPIIGYPVVTPVWVASIMAILGMRNLAVIVGVSVGLSLIAYMLLAKLAFVSPPMGPFGG